MSEFTSWLDIAEDTDFSLYNLPFGIFSTPTSRPRVGIAIGDQIVDLAAATELALFKDLPVPVNTVNNNYLNDFISLGKAITNAVRLRVQKWLCETDSPLKQHSRLLIPQADATMHLPVNVGDYTDFYSSIEHATNVGKMFRDPENALLPNWKHLPVGYHGRASSIIPSGQAIHRPERSGDAKRSHPTSIPSIR